MSKDFIYSSLGFRHSMLSARISANFKIFTNGLNRLLFIYLTTSLCTINEFFFHLFLIVIFESKLQPENTYFVFRTLLLSFYTSLDFKMQQHSLNFFLLLLIFFSLVIFNKLNNFILSIIMHYKFYNILK